MYRDGTDGPPSPQDTPAQIVAWAALFGSAQQLFTRFIDQQANTVLNDVRGSRNATTSG